MGPDLNVGTLVTVVLSVAVLPLAMLPALGVVVRRYGRLPAWPLLSALGLLGAGSALAAFTVFPLPEPGQLACDGGTVATHAQLVPFASIPPILHELGEAGLLGTLTGFTFLQVALNVLLFVPYGFFLHQVTRWRPLVITGIAAVTSLLIEVTQGTAVFGLYPCPYRTFDVDDLLTNTLGGVVGLAISLAVARRPFANPARVADTAPPGVLRRSLALLVDLLASTTLDVVVTLTLVAALADGATLEAAEARIDHPAIAIGINLTAFAAAVLLPSLLTRTGATPGQLLLAIAPVDVDDASRPRAARLIRRWGVRWVPWAIIPSLLPAIIGADLVSVLARRDHRSLSDLASATTMRTLGGIAQDRAAARPDDAVDETA
ncbi:VanZ family protein [Demequina maris]|uniref:VanZ family protein n=1 Tax=Demequina maris TaxID=1638982 RepID=UPI000784B7E0|nr:VanZ family protein [Demequina maris]